MVYFSQCSIAIYLSKGPDYFLHHWIALQALWKENSTPHTGDLKSAD